MALPSPLDLSALGPPRPVAVSGTIDTDPQLRLRLRWQPGANGGRGAWLADFLTPAGTPIALSIPVVLGPDLLAPHRIPAGPLPADRAFRVRRADGSAELRGTDPGLFDLGTGAVVVEIVERSP